MLSAAYYLKVIIVMFFRPRPEGAPELLPARRPTQFVIASSVALIMILGVYPSPVVRLARAAAPIGERTIAPTASELAGPAITPEGVVVPSAIP